MVRRSLFAGVLALFWTGCSNPSPEPLRVAVAANAVRPVEELARQFERGGTVRVEIVSGSSGKLFAQIQAGAPFALFFSADAVLPERLEAEGLAVKGSRFPYAKGRLVLWASDPELIDAEGLVLEQGRFRHLAIANPETAPYGAAARELLKGLGLWEKVAPKLVVGESVGQAYNFVATGNAELGFVAASQLMEAGSGGSRWFPPEAAYSPIEQHAAVLARAANPRAAQEFTKFVRESEAREVWKRYGYRTAEE